MVRRGGDGRAGRQECVLRRPGELREASHDRHCPSTAACHLGEIVALDKEATRELLGVGADARAYLLTRPYLKRSVRVEITDPADPTPYWVIGTRRPAELASAINAARAEVLG
ncbi:MAG TPA: DUF3093 family protein [Marmoricola sp.]|nr:DUF3093 family protein [Marmoricola sp.]